MSPIAPQKSLIFHAKEPCISCQRAIHFFRNRTRTHMCAWCGLPQKNPIPPAKKCPISLFLSRKSTLSLLQKGPTSPAEEPTLKRTPCTVRPSAKEPYIFCKRVLYLPQNSPKSPAKSTHTNTHVRTARSKRAVRSDARLRVMGEGSLPLQSCPQHSSPWLLALLRRCMLVLRHLLPRERTRKCAQPQAHKPTFKRLLHRTAKKEKHKTKWHHCLRVRTHTKIRVLTHTKIRVLTHTKIHRGARQQTCKREQCRRLPRRKKSRDPCPMRPRRWMRAHP